MYKNVVCTYRKCCYKESVNLSQWGAVGNAQSHTKRNEENRLYVLS